MAKGRVAQIVSQGDGLRQAFIEPQRFCDGPRNLGNLQGVGQTRPVMIALKKKKNLGLMLQTAKGFAVKDPVPVTLINRPDITRRLLPVPSQGFAA